MIVFRSGITRKQKKMFEKGKYVLYPKLEPEMIIVPYPNTFEYYDPNKTYKDVEEIKEYVSDDMYDNQYVFFFKYLNDALDYGYMSGTYVMVVDLDDNLLNSYIGCGIYEEYHPLRIEYRVPRRYIKKENILEFFKYTSNVFAYRNFIRKYHQYISLGSKKEDEEAHKLMLKKDLKFNLEKDFPIRK